MRSAPLNPYAPPVHTPPQGGLYAQDLSAEMPHWRVGDAVVMWRTAARLPHRCVRCNEPAKHRLARTVYWHEPWVYLTILAGLLIYAVLALVLRKEAKVDIGLCDKHKTRRTIGIAVGVLGFFGSFVMMFVAATSDFAPGIGIAAFGLLLWPIVGMLLARTVAPKRIDDHRVYLKVGRPFLESVAVAPAEAHVHAQGWQQPAPWQAGWPSR